MANQTAKKTESINVGSQNSWWHNILVWLPPFTLFSVTLFNFSSKDSKGFGKTLMTFAINLISIMTVFALPAAWYGFLRSRDSTWTSKQLIQEPLVVRKLYVAADAYRQAGHAVLGNSHLSTLLQSIFGAVFMLVAYVTLPLWAWAAPKYPRVAMDPDNIGEQDRQENTKIAGHPDGWNSKNSIHNQSAAIKFSQYLSPQVESASDAKMLLQGQGSSSNSEVSPNAYSGESDDNMLIVDDSGSVNSGAIMVNHPQLIGDVPRFPYQQYPQLDQDLSSMLLCENNHMGRQHSGQQVNVLVTHAVDTFLKRQKVDPNNALHALILPVVAKEGDRQSRVTELQCRLTALIASLPQVLDSGNEKTAIIMPFLDCEHWILMIYVVQQKRFIFINTLHFSNSPDQNRLKSVVDPLLKSCNSLLGDHDQVTYTCYGADKRTGLQQHDERCGDWVAAYTYAALAYLSVTNNDSQEIPQEVLLPWMYEYTDTVGAEIPVVQNLNQNMKNITIFGKIASLINTNELSEYGLDILKKVWGLPTM